MTGCLVFAYDFEIDGLRLATRATARTSLFLFLAAFSATSSAELAPCGLTHWQRRNRRCLGVAFGVSHFLHLGSFVAVAVADSALFFSLAGVATFALAGLAYLLLAGMIATSRQSGWDRLGGAGSTSRAAGTCGSPSSSQSSSDFRAITSTGRWPRS
jgi:hypothetical protein